jgi:hypothetical protein
LYGCENWSFISREENMLMVFRAEGLRRIFGPNSKEVPARWRTLRIDELHGFYSCIYVVTDQITDYEIGWESGTYDG